MSLRNMSICELEEIRLHLSRVAPTAHEEAFIGMNVPDSLALVEEELKERRRKPSTRTYSVQYANGRTLLLDTPALSPFLERTSIARRAEALIPWTPVVLIRPLRDLMDDIRPIAEDHAAKELTLNRQG